MTNNLTIDLYCDGADTLINYYRNLGWIVEDVTSRYSIDNQTTIMISFPN